jgi:sigma-B regulation protein RsbU (phosphoserine phosphatase)
MKLRWRLLISYLLVVVVCLGLAGVLTGITLEELARENLEAARTAVDEITEVTYRVSENVLTAYGQRMVRIKAEAVAKELAPLLKGKGPEDYPRLRRDESLRAVATQDLMSLEGVAGYLDLLDDTGVSVLHPNRSVEGRNFSEWKDKFPRMWELVQQSFREDLVQGYYTFIDRHNRERLKFMVLCRVPGTRFIICAVANIDQFFLPVHNRIRQAAQNVQGQALRRHKELYARSRLRMQQILLLSLGAALVVGLVFGLWFAAALSRPIQRLRDAVVKVGEGDFSVQVEPTGSAETRELAKAFNLMGSQLTVYMDRLKEETAAHQAVLSEVRIARRIQQALLPHSFPPFPHRSEMALYAVNMPAKEPACDFYDFFPRPDDHLVLVQADISSRGVHAALFMAITRTLLRNVCSHQPDPAAALTEANHMLCQDNEAAMFARVVLIYYHVPSGRLAYANAGYESPYLVAGDEVRPLEPTGEPALGVKDGHQYRLEDGLLAPDQVLFLYSDGLIQARSPSGEPFGHQRLSQTLAATVGEPVEEICNRVLDEVLRFQASDQEDDLTLLALRNCLEGA